ncbi:MAG TPA: YeeE/YedE family protein [Pseudomonadales bacterium]|nr:YeeE/YedE family protein [Pseudomonadales bacterium]HNN66362.1 YeeE/YedE family protein [Pseudomonadales bacterium]
MKARVAALISGILFGLGLTVSQMVNPKKVLGFLDVAGQWDPSLLLVMGGGVLVTVLSFPWIQRRGRPLWAERFSLPTRSDIDRNLLLGAALFGIGWAIAGYCPGPAIAALLINPAEAAPFVLAMLLGAWLQPRWLGR